MAMVGQIMAEPGTAPRQSPMMEMLGEMMQACVDTCRQGAESCHQMASMG